ncbi:hypothetical protein KH5H1_55110 [Corallococcus caeni]|uniref:phytanoyl-CoA dioxygenase family protein n=1 Tax=Corallococcus caeni TaxID=3082388 RepID=UPI00295624D4|nr:hypothetical protein KH5H1_55110 [Corallococcus sp. KH5-1]
MRRVFSDPAHEALFQREGAVVVPLLDASEVQSLHEAYHAHLPSVGMGFHATMFSRDVALRTRVDIAVRELLAPKVLPLLSRYRAVVGNFVMKEHGRRDSEVPVHQDWSFVEEPRLRSLNVWCPLVDTTPANGRLHVFKGSHNFVRVLRGPFFPNPYVTLAQEIRERFLTELPLRAGDAVIYDHGLVHASPHNVSGQARLAVNLALVPEEADLIHGYLDRSREDRRPEVFRVDDAFYLRNIVGERPQGVESLGFADGAIPQLSSAELNQLHQQAFRASHAAVS